MTTWRELIFWPGSPGERGFDEVLTAAAAGRFAAVAVSPLMISDLIRSGLSGSDLRERVRRRGLRVSELDGASGWAPIRFSQDMPDVLKARFNFSQREVPDLAGAAGADSILATGAFPAGALSEDELIERFALFCDLAGERGMRVELEFVPFWGIPTLEHAYRIVRAADRPNAGLMVDTWHLLKGSADPQAGLDLLKEIPSGRVTGLQLADALAACQAPTLYGEGRYRRFPGEGQLPLDSVIRLLLAGEGLQSVGSEVFGAAIDELDTDAAGERAGESTRDALRVAEATASD